MTTSKLFLKGLITAIIGALIAGAYAVITGNPPHFPTGNEWMTILMAAIAAGASYLIHGFLTGKQAPATSDLFSINFKEFLKGLAIAVFGVIVSGIYVVLTALPPHFPTGTEWMTILLAGASAGLSYIIRKYFTNSSDQFAKKE